ncbi:MAG: GAF domain-containing protein [Anaerolineae bacterium]|nr:GAF domain-containing protein [Anaerolineae bacterium]
MEKAKILVVDDEESMCKFMEIMLKKEGYSVSSSQDAAAALEQIKGENYDLVIADLMMPEMSGIELLSRAKSVNPELDFIMMTAFASVDSAIEALKKGAFDYITKPFKVEEMLEAIEQALQESRLRRDRAELMQQLVLANEELERRIKEFNILHGIGQAMNSLLHLQDLLERAVEAAVYVTGAQAAAVHLVDTESDELCLRAAQDFPEHETEESRAKLEEGILSKVVRTGRALITESPFSAPGPDKGGHAEAFLSVPLKIRGNVIGVLSVDNAASGKDFGQNDKYLLSVLADYVAIGVENARLYAGVQRRAEELALLNDVGQSLSSSLDLEDTLTVAMERVNEMLKVEAGSLLLLDEEAGELVFQIALGQKAHQVKPLRLKVGEGIPGRVAETGQPLLIPDVRQDSGYHKTIDVSTDFLAGSVLCVPMVARGEIIGVIEVINKVEGTFTKEDEGLLSSVAGYAAVAIDNARLFRKSRTDPRE